MDWDDEGRRALNTALERIEAIRVAVAKIGNLTDTRMWIVNEMNDAFVATVRDLDGFCDLRNDPSQQIIDKQIGRRR